jgi:hypothetical protein
LAFSALKLIGWTVAGAIILCAVGYPAAVFLASVLERRHLRKLAPVGLERADGLPPRAREWAAAAAAEGFVPRGLYSNGAVGLSEYVISLLLSPDGRTLLWVSHSRPQTFRLVSRFPGGNRLVTTDVPLPDGRRQDEEQVVDDAEFHLLLRAHLTRLGTRAQHPVPFAAERVPEQLFEDEERRVGTLVAAGLARRRGGDAWSYTLKGAARLVVDDVRSFGAVWKASTPPADDGA